MANSGHFDGSRQNCGIYDSKACINYWPSFYFMCGLTYSVSRSPRSRTGTITYRLQFFSGPSGGWYELHLYDSYINGASWGTLPAARRDTGNWYNLSPVATQNFTYNMDGTAPCVNINSGGAGFRCIPYCRGSWTTSIGQCRVCPDRVTPDWNVKPSGVSGSAANTTCTGVTLSFNVQDVGYPTAITTQIEYGTTTNYGNTTSTASSASGKFTLTGLNAGTTYHYRVKATNATGTTYSNDYTFKTKGSSPSAGTTSVTNPDVYRLDFSIGSIVWQGNDGCATTSRKAIITWEYTMDGKKYSFSNSWSGNTLGNSFSYSTGMDIDRVPDDETITWTWTLSTNIGSWSKSGTLYCQPSYEARVIGPSTNNKWVECELFTSEKAGINSYKKIRRVRKV